MSSDIFIFLILGVAAPALLMTRSGAGDEAEREHFTRLSHGITRSTHGFCVNIQDRHRLTYEEEGRTLYVEMEWMADAGLAVYTGSLRTREGLSREERRRILGNVSRALTSMGVRFEFDPS